MPAPFGPRTTQRSPSSHRPVDAVEDRRSPADDGHPAQVEDVGAHGPGANLSGRRRRRLAEVVAVPTAPDARGAVLVAWGNAFLAAVGRPATPRASAIRGRRPLAPRRRAARWRRRDPAGRCSAALRVLGATASGLRRLPVPGDVYGLPGPPDFNVAALTAGEAVLLDGPAAGLVPTVGPHRRGRPAAPEHVEAVRGASSPIEPRPSPVPSLRRGRPGPGRSAARGHRDPRRARRRPAGRRRPRELLDGAARRRVRRTELAPGHSDRPASDLAAGRTGSPRSSPWPAPTTGRRVSRRRVRPRRAGLAAGRPRGPPGRSSPPTAPGEAPYRRGHAHPIA